MGLLFIFAFYVFGSILAHAAGLAIPGSIVGLLALIVLLVMRKGDFPSVRSASGILLPLIPLFLIPICVSMVVTVPLDSSASWKLIGLVAISTVIGVILTSAAARFILPAVDIEKRANSIATDQRNSLKP